MNDEIRVQPTEESEHKVKYLGTPPALEQGEDKPDGTIDYNGGKIHKKHTYQKVLKAHREKEISARKAAQEALEEQKRKKEEERRIAVAIHKKALADNKQEAENRRARHDALMRKYRETIQTNTVDSGYDFEL